VIPHVCFLLSRVQCGFWRPSWSFEICFCPDGALSEISFSLWPAEDLLERLDLPAVDFPRALVVGILPKLSVLDANQDLQIANTPVRGDHQLVLENLGENLIQWPLPFH
jgi:hypothetical protein